MASTRDIKRRIRSVKSIQQITRAMKMVAAAKLRRSQDRMLVMRPYANGIETLLARFVDSLVGDENPLLAQVENPTKSCVLMISGDRGLCGSFNTNVIRLAAHTAAEHAQAGKEVSVLPVGRKAVQFFAKRDYALVGRYVGIFEGLSYSVSNGISDTITEGFADGSMQEVYLVYNEFKSVLQQNLRVKKILPFDVENLRHIADLSPEEATKPAIYEPSEEGICNLLLPRYLSTQIFRALLESYASEMASRMTAMESATSNAGEMIDNLTLSFNRARQASITQEISEIVGGANALEQG